MIYTTDFNTDDYKAITVEKLIEILRTLPSDWQVWTNKVKNLSVGDGQTWQGYIDFASDTWNPRSGSLDQKEKEA